MGVGLAVGVVVLSVEFTVAKLVDGVLDRKAAVESSAPVVFERISIYNCSCKGQEVYRGLFQCMYAGLG